MGVMLTYRTTAAVDPDIRRQIENDAKRLNASRDWGITEPIRFYDDPDVLDGSSKITPGADYAALVPDDEPDDVSFIVAQLERWSSLHKIAWSVGIDEFELGQIEDGSCSPELLRAIEGLAQVSEDDFYT